MRRTTNGNDKSPLVDKEIGDVQNQLSKNKKLIYVIFAIFVFIVFISSLIAVIFLAKEQDKRKHDLLFVINSNGAIYTMDPDTFPINTAEAFCIDVTDSKFVYVGDHDDVYKKCRKRLHKSLKQIDAANYTILPGLIDAHVHMMSLGANFFKADLSSAKSIDDIVNILQEFVDKHSPFNESKWLQGWGWDQNNWDNWDPDDLPTRWMLDNAFPTIKIFLRRIDGHAAWINTAALNYVPTYPDQWENEPEGGTIVRDDNGNITGALIDRAMDLVTPYINAWTLEERHEMLELVLMDCASNGLTGVQDSGTIPDDVDLFLSVIDDPETYGYNFTLRVNSFANAKAPGGYQPSDYVKRFFYKDILTINGVKFRMDGALGSWGAAFVEPYCDHTNETGLLMYDDINDFYNNISLWHEEGYQITVHCIGDLANRLTIDQYIRLIKEYNLYDIDHRLRIEHAQIVNISVDLPKMVQNNIIPSMQPTHCTSDMVFAGDRLNCSQYGYGERLSGAYAWQTMLNAGVKVMPFGSDFPSVGVVNPFLGIYAAITRQNENGEPSGGWIPENRVSIYQALKGYTYDAAYSSFQENYLGSITKGKYADFIIIDRDIMTVDDPMKILNTTVIATYLGGEKVYQNNNPRFTQFN